MPKPRIRSPLRKGTLVYHGTSGEEAKTFEMLQGPAWVSDSIDVARWFAERYGPGKHTTAGRTPMRVFTFRVTQSPRLAVVHDNREWMQFIHWVYDYSVGSYDPYELAEEVCTKGLDGWHIPHNYPEGSDTLLCEPERFLEFVEFIDL